MSKRLNVHLCSCSALKRASQFAKHVKQKKENGDASHCEIREFLACTSCKKADILNSQAFLEQHSECKDQTRMNDTTVLQWFGSLHLAKVPQQNQMISNLGLAELPQTLQSEKIFHDSDIDSISSLSQSEVSDIIVEEIDLDITESSDKETRDAVASITSTADHQHQMLVKKVEKVRQEAIKDHPQSLTSAINSTSSLAINLTTDSPTATSSGIAAPLQQTSSAKSETGDIMAKPNVRAPIRKQPNIKRQMLQRDKDEEAKTISLERALVNMSAKNNALESRLQALIEENTIFQSKEMNIKRQAEEIVDLKERLATISSKLRERDAKQVELEKRARLAEALSSGDRDELKRIKQRNAFLEAERQQSLLRSTSIEIHIPMRLGEVISDVLVNNFDSYEQPCYEDPSTNTKCYHFVGHISDNQLRMAPRRTVKRIIQADQPSSQRPRQN